MTRVELSDEALAELDALIERHQLPTDTRTRVYRSLRLLQQFPLRRTRTDRPAQRPALDRRAWGWLRLIYFVLPDEDRVIVVSVQDARRSRADLP